LYFILDLSSIASPDPLGPDLDCICCTPEIDKFECRPDQLALEQLGSSLSGLTDFDNTLTKIVLRILIFFDKNFHKTEIMNSRSPVPLTSIHVEEEIVKTHIL
jgi:hypothetical protein